MTQSTIQYIPAGRTARFTNGDKEIQVQTEFAPRPTPRITSTILISGEVVKKFETPLESPISSQEELDDVERILLKQHSSVLKRAREMNEASKSHSMFDNFKSKLNIPTKKILSEVKPSSNLNSSGPFDSGGGAGAGDDRVMVKSAVQISELSESDKINIAKRTTLERLYAIEGVTKAHTISCSGEFLSEKNRVDFKDEFPDYIKHLSELVRIFNELSDSRGRENGIYEIEPRRLYMVSHCGFIYLLVMGRVPSDQVIEEVIKEALW